MRAKIRFFLPAPAISNESPPILDFVTTFEQQVTPSSGLWCYRLNLNTWLKLPKCFWFIFMISPLISSDSDFEGGSILKDIP